MELLKKFLQHGELEYTHKRLGLERVCAVLERLGYPEKTFPSVLIAGTNGKGSVCRMVESVMLAAGYPVGLYTSPHVERFTERIRVDGEEVPEDFLEEILRDFYHRGILNSEGEMEIPVVRGFSPVPDRQVRPFGSESGLKALATWFEKTTVLAFEVFRRKQVPLAVLEVGLGARLDATNVVDSLVSGIASVSYDHTEVLGNSLFEIAQEKAAVMRSGRPVVLGPMAENVRTFLNKAARMGQAKPVMPVMPRGTWRNFSYGPFENLRLSLPGGHQLGNAATAIEILVALKETGFKIDNSHIHRGLEQARLPGRLEIFPGEPTILLDGAHNEASMEALVEFIQREFSDRPLTVLLGMMQDKDVSKVLEILAMLVVRGFSPDPQTRYIFTQVSSPRAVTTDQWGKWLRAPGRMLQGDLVRDPHEALEVARRVAPPEGVLVITGSFYLVGELRGACRSHHSVS
jgi:dihydrofolate synthase/folylpolyglutamate synthase